MVSLIFFKVFFVVFVGFSDIQTRDADDSLKVLDLDLDRFAAFFGKCDSGKLFVVVGAVGADQRDVDALTLLGHPGSVNLPKI